VGGGGIIMTDYVWHDENYDKRIQLTIDGTKVNEDLTDFPVLIHLSNDSGITHVDATSVFEELTTSGSRTKIAVYTVSGTEDVQCYTEIDKWIITASGVGESWLWVKVPTLSSGVDTQLYLYYDKDVSDNITYVGDTNSLPAAQVWTNDFELVYHMSNGASDTTVYDSTLNSYDGTKTTSTRPDEAEGKIGNAQSYYDGSLVGRIQTGVATFKEVNDFTVEVLINPDTIGSLRGIVSRTNGSSHNFMCVLNSPGYMEFFIPNTWHVSTNSIVTTGSWQQISWVKSSNIIEYFYNGYKDSQDSVGTVPYTATIPTNIGWWSDSYSFDGDMDEIRLSSCARSSAWLEATYYSNFDNLITFGSEEPKPSFVFNGYVQVQGSPAERTVYLYHRSTGAFVGSAVSNPSTGYFEIPTPFNDYHFVNILPELAEDYNIIVRDKIVYGS
jgi:hypothetical protein